MISFASVWAIVLRLARVWRRDVNLLLAGFYWPLLDILVWGFLGSWVAQGGIAQYPNYKATVLLGILLWGLVGRGSNLMGFSFCEELWSNNIVNLFSLPLRITEWMIGIVLFYLIIISITSAFSMIVIALVHDVNLFDILPIFLMFAPPLLFSGIWLGFTCLQVCVTLGKRGVELGFVVGWFLMPFCGAYYPVDVLPVWGQKISACLPMSYVFKAMREYLMHQQDPTSNLIIGYVLSIIYATSAALIFVYCFNRSKRRGLARLAD